MPRYSYKCKECAFSFEKRENYNSNETIDCENCNKLSAIRQFSPPLIIFKGDGWYVNRKDK